MSPPAVSIVIPVYNDTRHIGVAIATALAQTEPNIEVIVVDDCSTDGTPALVQEFAARDPRVRYVRMERNSGPSACRNRGFDLARGEWVAPLDSDDRYDPSRLAILLGLARREGADMVSDNVLLCPVGDEPDQVMISPAILSAPRQMSFLEFMHGCMWSKTVKRSAYVLMMPMFRREFLRRTGARYDPRSRKGELPLHGAGRLADRQGGGRGPPPDDAEAGGGPGPSGHAARPGAGRDHPQALAHHGVGLLLPRLQGGRAGARRTRGLGHPHAQPDGAGLPRRAAGGARAGVRRQADQAG